jgi:DNA-binding XRE family transcriptional regulator
MEAGTVNDLLARVRERNVPLPPPRVRRARRQAAELSQDDVAGFVGVNRASVARWELGLREPRDELRRRYAELLEELAGR